MPPKQSKSAVSSAASGSVKKPKLRQNKLDFGTLPTRPLASRPLSFTPSFSLPSSEPAPRKATAPHLSPASASTPSRSKGKQKEVTTAEYQSTTGIPALGSSLWSERLAPAHIDELAVHPRKVQDVRTWLSEALNPASRIAAHRKLLTLTGPAGAGKSTVVRALSSATELDFDIIEWHNGPSAYDETSPQNGTSFVQRFNTFLQKGARYPTLAFRTDSGEEVFCDDTFEQHASTSEALRRKIILIDDLPNIHHHPTKQVFQACLERFLLQAEALSTHGTQYAPVVLIITESSPREDQDRWVTDSSISLWRERLNSIVDARTVLNDAIRRHASYAEIRFNPVAPTILLKGLKRAIDNETRTRGTSLAKLSSELLRAVAEDAAGDIRAAVNSLQFICQNSTHFEALAASNTGSKRKRSGATSDSTAALRRLMPLVSGRESSLALFHAIGRVLYNKRIGDPGDDDGAAEDHRATQGRANSATEEDNGNSQSDGEQTDLAARLKRAMKAISLGASDQSEAVAPSDGAQYELPQHLAHLRRRRSRVDVDQLWADLPVDASMFQLYLHQNYPQFTAEVEDCEAIVDCISAADALSVLEDSYRHSSLLSYYGFLITVHGSLLGLPSPVARQHQKLGKATYWEVQKKTRQTLEAVDELKAWLCGGGGRLLAEPGEPGEPGWGQGGSSSWSETRFRRTKFSNLGSFSSTDSDAGQESGLEPRGDAGLGESLRSSLLHCNVVSLTTEVLPLLAMIRPEGSPANLLTLARMRFDYAGVADLAARTLDEHEIGLEGQVEEEESSMEQKANVSNRSGSSARASSSDVAATTKLEVAKPVVEEKLYLSDDDIADF
ncbi:hypothetical protein BCV70DRAFT_199934 [Testicularia cyperi]|uniref:Cell cycle checkpoint protein RAD17 n=1 Tax=Testicularia cyperi TaxID=1882483 RepID=A0A317XQZ0_9BASI|nr:hypothetical protein BCV70DRAFT_199934 [Testicularia cyperi]